MKRQAEEGRLPCLLFLALFFLGGVIMGQVLTGRVPAAAGEELERYLADYLRLGGAEAPALPAAALYFRYPLAAFLLGFTALGAALVPCLTAAFGFFLSFSVCCFTAVFGAEGVLLALAVFGLRCLVTLPCYLLLAADAWTSSVALASQRLGRPGTAGGEGGRWLSLWAAAAFLFAGMCVDHFLSPWLLQMILERIFG